MQEKNTPSSLSSPSEQPISRHESRSLPKVLAAVLAVIVIGLAVTAAHFYFKYEEMTKRMTPQGELETLLSSLSGITDLPTGETPTLATVTDRTRLSEQAFFSRAENGDKILLYREAGRAFLYRPSTGKLVNVTTVTGQSAEAISTEQKTEAMPSPHADQSTVPQPAPDIKADDQAGNKNGSGIKVILYNGTAETGVTHEFENDFLVDNPDVEVVDKKPAARKDYDRTIIIDISKKFTSIAESIAENAGTSVEDLPDGETVPDDIDVLIIIGRDRI